MTTPLRPRKWKAPLRRAERIVAGPRGEFTLEEAAQFLQIDEREVLYLLSRGVLVAEEGESLALPRAYLLAYAESRPVSEDASVDEPAEVELAAR